MSVGQETLVGAAVEVPTVVADLVQRLHGVNRLGVAYSGGVDSALLAALAVRALGAGQVVAVLGVSPSLAEDERRQAHEVARVIGVPVVEVVTHEGESAAYRANGPDRCYHCKDELFTRISDEVVERLGLDAVAYGENADDALRPDRPGSRADRKGGARSSLCATLARTPSEGRTVLELGCARAA